VHQPEMTRVSKTDEDATSFELQVKKSGQLGFGRGWQGKAAMLIGLIWPNVEYTGGFLCRRLYTFQFHKPRRISDQLIKY